MIQTSIAPWLTVHSGTKAVAFYKSAFAAIETYHLEAPDGAIVARLSIDGAEFWISDGSADSTCTDGERVRMILTTSDPDTFFARALKAGASEVFAVEEGHGWRLGRLVDPFGHHWEIGHPLASI